MEPVVMTALLSSPKEHGFVTRRSKSALAEALFSLSQTQRRLAHRYRRWAIDAERKGDRPYFLHCQHECRRLWRESKDHLSWARREYSDA